MLGQFGGLFLFEVYGCTIKVGEEGLWVRPSARRELEVEVFGALVSACGDHVVELMPCGCLSVYIVDCDGLLTGDVNE